MTINMCSTSRTVKSALLERVIQTKLFFRFVDELKTALREANSVGRNDIMKHFRMIYATMFIPSMIHGGVRHSTVEMFRLYYFIHNSVNVILKIGNT